MLVAFIAVSVKQLSVYLRLQWWRITSTAASLQRRSRVNAPAEFCLDDSGAKTKRAFFQGMPTP